LTGVEPLLIVLSGVTSFVGAKTSPVMVIECGVFFALEVILIVLVNFPVRVVA